MLLSLLARRIVWSVWTHLDDADVASKKSFVCDSALLQDQSCATLLVLLLFVSFEFLLCHTLNFVFSNNSSNSSNTLSVGSRLGGNGVEEFCGPACFCSGMLMLHG